MENNGIIICEKQQDLRTERPGPCCFGYLRVNFFPIEKSAGDKVSVLLLFFPRENSIGPWLACKLTITPQKITTIHSKFTHIQPDKTAVEYNVTREKKQGEYTLEDYYTQPDDRRVELIDGKFFEMEAPTFVHQHLISMLQYPMITYIQKKKGQCIPMQSPVDVRLDCDDRTMVQPDLIVICDRDKIRRWGIDGAPDFVLEVLSDSSKRKDCILKLQKYACAGVREYWIIDPFKKTLITYDFSEDFVPVIRPLKGMAPLAIFGGELEIDLDSLAEVIRDWPNDGAE